MPFDMTLKKLGRYEIKAKIGEGGMGTVFEALDPVLERKVALKISRLFDNASSKPDQPQLALFIKEARLAAQFIHPNIAITYDAGFEEDMFFMALEFIDGAGLQMHSRPPQLLPKAQVIEIIYNICYALDYIHSKGYLHLDIKPSNIMLTQKGEVKLMDFGISRLMKERPQAEDGLAGSIFYLAPEQAYPGQQLNHQTDLYSLGAVLYELLCGQRLYEGDDPYQLLYKISHKEPMPIANLIPEISPEISRIIQRALNKDRKKRFQSAREFADALQPIIRGNDTLLMDQQDKRKMAFLRQLYMFRHFQLSDLKEIIRLSAWNAYKKDTWILETSDSHSKIYVMIHGTASLHLGEEAKPLQKGEVFGESAILYPLSAGAKIRAESDCVVMSINANLLNQADESLQVKFLKEFYSKKVRQLVEANLKMIRQRF
ncbi:MAG: serine/threonine-protein kinase [Desulfobacterales bacterium]|jgi:serine/threonine-protein kinase|nr:serine/threonine-protein kinase [Desulfobacterales bacterium]